MSGLIKSSRSCRPGYKSRSKIMRSANRFKQFILDKTKKETLLIKNENLKMEEVISQVKEQNEQLSIQNKDLSIELNSLIKSSQDLKTALDNQRDRCEKRHKTILQTKLVEQNTKFNNFLQTYLKEINRLNLLVESKPLVGPPADYRTHGLDLRKSNVNVPSVLQEASNHSAESLPSVSQYRDRLKRLREAGGLSNND